MAHNKRFYLVVVDQFDLHAYRTHFKSLPLTRTHKSHPFFKFWRYFVEKYMNVYTLSRVRFQ